MQNPDARHITVPYRITIYTWKIQGTCILTVTLLNKTDRIRRIVTAISSSQTSLSPFWFQLLTIFSVSASFIGRDFYQRQLLVFRIVKIKIIIVTLITSYTNLATLKPDTHAPVQTRFFTYTLQWYFDCHCVYEVHACGLWQFPWFFFEFADQSVMKTLGVILVWAYHEQCVHL